MSGPHDLGHWGEALAAQWLEAQGWQIEARNWRHGPLELDLVAREGTVMVFVEVKTARKATYGTPDVRLTPAKQEALARAAAAYMYAHGYDGEIRFDLISILAPSPSSYTIRHFRDAFFPGL